MIDQVLKNLNILVTGADGFIGSHLCEKLVHNGAKVKALVAYNSFNKSGWLDDLPIDIQKEIEIVSGDIRDSDFVESISKDANLIFHLAALISIPYSYQAPRSYVDTNVIGTLNILQSARKYECQRIISTSTSEVYGSAQKIPIDETHILQAQSPYAASKIAADHILESFVKSFEVPAIILRPFNTYGPRQSERAVISSIIRQVLDDNCASIKVGDLSTKRDFNYIDDTVNAFIKLGSVDSKSIEYGTAYNSGSGKAVTIKETLEKIIKLSNTKKEIEQEAIRFRPKNSEVNHLIASSTKLCKLTGWKPEVDLTEGLKRTIAWWDERNNKNKLRNFSDYVV